MVLKILRLKHSTVGVGAVQNNDFRDWYTQVGIVEPTWLLNMFSKEICLNFIEYHYQVARRSLFLALIGLLLGSLGASWDTIRLPGVLQRLAAMYLVVGALECAYMKISADLRPGIYYGIYIPKYKLKQDCHDTISI